MNGAAGRPGPPGPPGQSGYKSLLFPFFFCVCLSLSLWLCVSVLVCGWCVCVYVCGVFVCVCARACVRVCLPASLVRLVLVIKYAVRVSSQVCRSVL
jgi:hypothetical protein